ncbi:MAG TPA: response regulator [Mycobacteriales bacterium]|jgi:CheY-like chemotaxis protein|nr:response regulator [Mycobacteriales bacterium]
MAKVLIVEDGVEVQALLKIRLTRMGHQVMAAGTGEEALEMLAGKPGPDVAVLDVMLPGMSGLELHGWLRRDPALAHVPVIFLSSRILPADIEAGRSLGATYLTKPVILSALTGAIEAALAARTAANTGW